MKADYKQAQLDELTDVNSPITYGVVKPGDPGDVLFVRGGDLAGGRVRTDQLRTITKAVSNQYQRTCLRGGELLICLVGQPGQVAVAPPNLAGANIARQVGLVRLRPSIDSEFVSYFLRSPDGQARLGTYAGGSVQQVINLSDLRKLEVPIPPLAEQHRIVALLDKAFEALATAKANAEQNLQNARDLFKGQLESVFSQRGEGWEESSLKSITTKIGSGATPRGGEQSYKAKGISLIRSLNVHDLAFRYSKLAFLDDAQANELSNVEVQARDVLLNITGASVARCTIVPDDVLPARVNQHVSIIRPDPARLDSNYLHYLLISRPHKDKLLRTGEEGGSTRQAITKAQIEAYRIAYPASLKKQEDIVAKLDAMLGETQHLTSIYERKLAALEELKTSLLHQAFNGEL